MRSLLSMDRKQWEIERHPKEECDQFESRPCCKVWLGAERWIPAVALGSDLQALLCHRREKSLSVSCCSQVGFLLSGGLCIKPPLHFPLTAHHIVLLAARFFPSTVLVSTGARIRTGQSIKMHSFINCRYHSHNYQSVAIPLPRSIHGINTLSKAQWFIHSSQI